MGRLKSARVKQSVLEEEASSIEYSVRLAERLARDPNAADDDLPTDPVSGGDSLADEVSSIEFSVRLAERMANDPNAGPMDWPIKKLPVKASVEGVIGPGPAVQVSFMKSDRVWPRLSGWSSRDLRREARYQMYHVYEHYPEEMHKLVVQVIAKGCSDLDEKGARDFAHRVWRNKRLQENLQGAMNATYFRELFDGEELRMPKRTVPEIYLEGDHPEIVFTKMKTFLFRNRDIPNGIYLMKVRKNRNSPLAKQLYDLFEAAKRESARRRARRAIH